MRQDIISQVRKAEENAERTLQETHAEVDQILRDARRQAAERRQEILSQARQEAKQRFEQGAKALEPEVAAIHQQSEGAISSDTQQARAQFDAAVEVVVNRFRERFVHKQFGNG
jgi:vacuolar-type H+-ATPase subunit H